MTDHRLSRLVLACLLASAAALTSAAEVGGAATTRESSASSDINASAVTPASAQARAEASFRARDYAGAVDWSLRYFKEGGNDSRMRSLLARASYFSNDFENAARNLHVEVSQAERANLAPTEEGLKLLAACYARLNDITGQIWALEKLVTYYPKREHWAELILQTEKRANLSEGLALDLWRLKLVTGTLQTSADYLQAVKLALGAGYPADAKAMLDKGFASGVLGTGAEADNHRRLRDSVARQTAEGKKAASDREPPAPASAPRFGSPQIDAGFRLVGYGETARGIAMMERELQQAGSKRPQVDKLHLGIAYLMAGRKSEAIAIFKTVTGVHGAADLGRLWYLYALRSSMS